MIRSNFVGAPQFYNLQCSCAMLVEAFGYHIYHVGSSLDRRDYRDVDVRCILPDEEFDRLFPNISGSNYQTDAFWNLVCCAISEWLQTRTNLPIDFQIQRQTQANAENENCKRNALGLFIRRQAEPSAQPDKDQK